MSLAQALGVIPQHMTGLFILIGIVVGLKIVVDKWVSDKQREKRRTYYRRHVREFRRVEAQAGTGLKAR